MIDFLIAFFIFVSGVGGYFIGRRDGIDAERLRVNRIFDVALGVVTSGALWKVRRRINNEYDNDQLQAALVRECDFRDKERRRRAS